MRVRERETRREELEESSDGADEEESGDEEFKFCSAVPYDAYEEVFVASGFVFGHRRGGCSRSLLRPSPRLDWTPLSSSLSLFFCFAVELFNFQRGNERQRCVWQAPGIILFRYAGVELLCRDQK